MKLIGVIHDTDKIWELHDVKNRLVERSFFVPVDKYMDYIREKEAWRLTLIALYYLEN